jgi:DNA mismatch repair protein MutH
MNNNPARNGSRVILRGRAEKTRLIVKNYTERGRNIEAVLSTFYLHRCSMYRINRLVS